MMENKGRTPHLLKESLWQCHNRKSASDNGHVVTIMEIINNINIELLDVTAFPTSPRSCGNDTKSMTNTKTRND